MTRRKDGLWQQSVTCVVNGRKIQKYFYGKTKAEVLRKIQAYSDEQTMGPEFGAVADEWWAHHEPTIAVNTAKSYRPALKRAKERFGTSRIHALKPADINLFIRDFIKDKSASRKTAATQLLIMNLIFSYAVENGYVQTNPVRDVSLPRNLSKGRRELPGTDQIKRVKDSADKPFGMFAYWVLYTGCRRGELQALTWDDVDIKGGWIHVTKSLYYKDGKPAIKSPKTAAGSRDIPLMKKLAEKLAPGKGIIFANKKGEYLSEWQFQKSWKSYCEASGVTCTPHQLRHAYATMLYENNIAPKDAQALLGHAQLSTTMDIYTHIREEQEERLHTKLLDLDIAT